MVLDAELVNESAEDGVHSVLLRGWGSLWRQIGMATKGLGTCGLKE